MLQYLREFLAPFEEYREIIQWAVLFILCVLIVIILQTIGHYAGKWKVRNMHKGTTEEGIDYFHHGDFSGDVRIVLSPVLSVDVPYNVLRKIVLEKMRYDHIAKLENMNVDELQDIFNIFDLVKVDD